MAYASEADYLAWTQGEPSSAPWDIDRQLARASEAVDVALIGAVYPVDASGNPTEARVIDALRDATCAQVEWWAETGDELGAQGQYSSVGIGSVSLVRHNSATTGSGGHDLAPRALDCLRVAGLLPVAVATESGT